MVYLNIGKDGLWLRWEEPDPAYAACYQITAEANNLFEQWYQTPIPEESVICGVLADYLQDHKDEQIPIRPSDSCWDAMVAHLRKCFDEPILGTSLWEYEYEE